MKCPGQDMQYWTAEAIYEVNCPKCGKSVEFYKDDTTRSCSQCGHRFVNPRMDFGCAAYCKFAEQCIGTLPEEFVGAQDNLFAKLWEINQNATDDSGNQPSAAKILETLGANEEIRNEVCALIEALNNGRTTTSPEAGSLADAAAITLLEERNKEMAIDEEQFTDFITEEITTEAGRMVARSVFSHLAVS